MISTRKFMKARKKGLGESLKRFGRNDEVMGEVSG